jgi:TRAP-type C4-dicarboxylate transport system permease large subunit
VATAAAMGKVAIPEMLRQGYDRPLVAGIIIGGSIGALIPPA